jgi:hypothetical protein
MRGSKKIQSRRARTMRKRRMQKSRRVKRTYRRKLRGGVSMNNNNNNNNNNNVNPINAELYVILLQELYASIDRIEDHEQRNHILEAIGGWLYAVFVTRPKLNPGNTKEGMILSLLHETQKYLGYELDRQTAGFDSVMDELHTVYNKIRELVAEDKQAELSELQTMQEEYQGEYERQYGL